MASDKRERCSRGYIKRYCCDDDVMQNTKDDYPAWAWVYYYNDCSIPPDVVALAKWARLDPHDVDDDFSGRGWDYGRERSAEQLLFAVINCWERIWNDEDQQPSAT